MSEWFYKKISQYAGYLAVAALFGLIVFAANIEIKDVDLWLHLSVGKHILQTFSVPKADFLSCTIANTPWTDHEWLFQVCVSWIYTHAGIEGLIRLKVVVVFLTFMVLLFLGYTRERQLGPVFMLLLVLLAYQLRLTLRPDMFSLLFFALYISLIGLHPPSPETTGMPVEEGENDGTASADSARHVGRMNPAKLQHESFGAKAGHLKGTTRMRVGLHLDKRWTLGAAVLIQVVWTNMHGFFIFGPLLVLTAIGAEWIKRHIYLPFEWNDIGRLSDAEYRRLKWMFLLVFLSCFANPYFVEGAVYPFGVFFSLGGENKVFFDQIRELQRPITLSGIFDWRAYFPYKLLMAISFLSFVFNRRKIDINALFLWIIFLLASLATLRNMAYFAVTAYFVFLANSQYLSAGELLAPRWNNEKFKAVLSTVLKAALIIWIVGYGGRLMLRGYYDFDRFERKSEFGGLSQRNFPHQAVDFLADNNIKGNFFNDFNSGAYLAGRAAPDIKVFIDGRTEVYGPSFYKNYGKIWKGDAALFEGAEDRYHLTGAFLNSVYVPAPQKLIKYLYDRKDWVLVYFDYDASIFLKDVPANQVWIGRWRMDLAGWQTSPAPLRKIGTYNVEPYRYVSRAYALYNMGFPKKAENECIEALRIEPYNAKAHKLLGKIYNDRGEYGKGFESLRKAKLVDPDDMKVRYQIALALYHLGEFEKAEGQCRRVLSRNPKSKKAQDLMALIRSAKGEPKDK